MNEIFRLEVPYREPYSLRCLDFGSGSPRVAVVAGLHGTELNGVHAVNLVATALRLAPIRGSVRLFPVVNTFGLDQAEKRWPLDDRDINQAFPGDPRGSAVQRIAHALMEATEADLCVDIHSGSALMREIPQVRVPLTGAEASFARAMGLPMVWRREGDNLDATGLVGAWRERGRTALHVVGGRGSTLDLAYSRDIADALLRLLRHLGLVHMASEVGHVLVDTTRRGVSYHYSDMGGFWVPKVKVGDKVQAGHLLGSISEVIGGGLLDEVRADRTGLVVSMRAYPVVHGRELLVRVAELRT